ncbi:replication associated protein [Bovine faeces associated smacovirus 2]|uniref:Replication associated protein n=1 Tax=Bovine faeces associated smacovirus 2 TaxID=1843750 RepID=A0A160HX09_9VIRU|nr:replication associated protein [Bovine faeces associated smacovirus 2]ANC51523.1 replication associated protein [Bovine faeces associated smacovirus 2]
MTGPRTIHKRIIREIFKKCDVKKYIIAMETGNGGYEHWQIRCTASRPDFFEYVHDREPRFNIQKAETESMEYERKEGRFWSSEDTTEIRQCRFGELGGKGREWQRQILKVLKNQDVRTIDVVLDPVGARGKSHFTIALWERGEALVVPRYSCTSEKLSAFVCSAYKGEKIIIIDIPRANKPTTALYESMEEMKDGLVFDPRYSGKTRNIRGTKVLVFTNNPLDLKKLSHDRWNLHGITRDGTLS